MTIKENIHELNNMVVQGKLLEAFEKFYDEKVVMQENAEPPRVGKNKNREFEKRFVASVQKMHDAKVNAVAYNEDTAVSMVEWEFDMTFKDGKRKKMSQVSVQTWKNGKIINERFFYNSK